MARVLNIALAQIDPLVGDVAGNRVLIEAAVARARAAGADLVVFPELAVCGYPPDDLLFREGFVEACEAAVERLAGAARDIAVLVGHPRRVPGGLANAATLLAGGERRLVYDKQLLPNYGVFDEKRYFVPGTEPAVTTLGGVRIGVTICEDIWQPGPARAAREAGAELLINLNASPFHVGKLGDRLAVLRQRCNETGLPVVYVNLVGGQDELVFDGRSLVVDGAGRVCAALPGFEPALEVVRFEDGRPCAAPQDLGEDEDETVYRALVLAIRDYVRKNGFNGVVLGLSGGVDSALTAALAVDALGAEAVQALMMPSRYTSSASLEDARALARNLGLVYHELSIEGPFGAFVETLRPLFAGADGQWPADVTQENIQARCRGVLLMAVSNKTGALVLATGNKSELSVGYATLYGDMAGGYAPLKDVYKQRVYRLCRYRNAISPVIPERVLTRPPTAELAENQKDEDSLPPYPLLDAILERYIDGEASVERIVAEGFDPEVVRDVVRRVDRNEYKRRQAAPGVKITRRAFGRERRYPITCGYRP
ncbi:MAG: NAD+ synthase [Gammaproteobacteria bacterium]|nr:MAG: NAD+ synthase [Gammaproteobacteria bacterium]